MKRILLFFVALSALVVGHAQRTIQGVPVDASRHQRIATLDYMDPASPEGEDGSFTFDMIQNWTGEGSKRAALVIQFNDPRETHALVFGYRFDGEASGEDMIIDVVKNNPRLYWLSQRGTAYGSTVSGIGWDADNDGDIALYNIVTDETLEVVDDWNLFLTSSYDYDNYISVDTADYWSAGWYQSYWSYWTKASSDATFGYSSVGITGRKLTDGCWDGWNFAVGMSPQSWKPLKAAPLPSQPVTFKKDGIYYGIQNKRTRTVKVTEPVALAGETLSTYSGEVSIPSSVVYKDSTYSVVGVRDYAFRNSQATSVTLPPTVTSFGRAVFSGSAQLTSATLPTTLTALPDSTFAGTALTAFDLSGLTSVGAHAFAHSQLRSLLIPSSVTTLGSMAFNTSSLIDTVSVERLSPLSISDDVFSSATYASATLNVPSGYGAAYQSADGWKNFTTFSEHYVTVSEGDRFPSNGLYYVLIKKGEGEANGRVAVSYAEVETYSATNVKTANKTAYVGDLVIPSEVEYMGRRYTVTAIGDSAFIGATALTSLVFPSTIDSLGIHLADGCTSLAAADLSGITFNHIPEYAFYNCSKLTAVSFPMGCESIGRYAYYRSGVAALTLPSGVTTIEGSAFRSCTSLTEVIVPSTVTTLGSDVFNGCTGLQKAVLTNEIGSSTFYGCSNLVSATLPDSVRVIPGSMFYNCSKLSELNVFSRLTEVGSSAFYGCKLLVSELPAQLTTIGTSAFRNCVGLSGSLPSTITSIGNYAFYGCTGITGDLPSGLTSLGTYAFYGCKGLTGRIHLPAAIKTVGSSLFYNCSGIESLVLSPNTTSVSSKAVYGCTALKEIFIPTPAKLTFSSTYLQLSSSSYPTLVVPSSLAAAYQSAYASYTVRGVEPQGLKSSGRAEIDFSDYHATLNAVCTYTVAEDVPEVMQSALFASTDVMSATFTIREQGTPSVISLPAEKVADGFTAVVQGLKASSNYEYWLRLQLSNAQSFTTDTLLFTVPAPVSDLRIVRSSVADSDTLKTLGTVLFYADAPVYLSDSATAVLLQSSDTLSVVPLMVSNGAHGGVVLADFCGPHFAPLALADSASYTLRLPEGSIFSADSLRHLNESFEVPFRGFIARVDTLVTTDTLVVEREVTPELLTVSYTVGGYSVSRLLAPKGQPFTLTLSALDDHWEVDALLLDGEDVTSSLSDGVFVIDSLTTPVTLSLTLRYAGAVVTESATGVVDVPDSQLSAFSRDGRLVIDGLQSGDEVSIYSLTGGLLKRFTATADHAELTVPTGQTYLIRVNTITMKLFNK